MNLPGRVRDTIGVLNAAVLVTRLTLLPFGLFNGSTLLFGVGGSTFLAAAEGEDDISESNESRRIFRAILASVAVFSLLKTDETDGVEARSDCC